MYDTSRAWARQAVGRLTAGCAIAGLSLLPATAFCADTPDLLNDSFYVALGSFIINTDTTVRLDGEAGEQGRELDWEKTFGEGDVNRFRLDGYWRFAGRHKVRAVVFSSSRDKSKTIEEDIEWGGETYPASATVDAKFDFDVYELAYEYAFIRRESYELAGSIGLHYTDLTVSLGATVTGPGGATSQRLEDSGDLAAPLPVFGLRGTWALLPTLTLDASVQYFAMSYDNYDGSLRDYRVVLNWQPKRWLGLGIGYDYFDLNLDVDGARFAGKLEWIYEGPMIFYSASF